MRIKNVVSCVNVSLLFNYVDILKGKVRRDYRMDPFATNSRHQDRRFNVMN